MLATLQAKLIAAGGIILAIASVVLSVFVAGRNSGKLSDAKAKLKEAQANAKSRANVDRMSNADVRDQLRDRWQRK